MEIRTVPLCLLLRDSQSESRSNGGANMTKFRRLYRPTGHRMSMLRTMVSQLIKHHRIETTVAKAKEVRRLADNMIQLGKQITVKSLQQTTTTRSQPLLTICSFRSDHFSSETWLQKLFCLPFLVLFLTGCPPLKLLTGSKGRNLL
ncbi:uncharacterized protein LOC130954138 isoform X1 [Arachis stenosperma]|uniref:uncharacterized protein LOC130954138 isoform X1 n=1 Tax=Arachis stenosperma TaxID=217475 RepID=UPI0025AC5F57|nr:uncharacterized protein LOC130954138 isoform X1 [Arachis stenosperma]